MATDNHGFDEYNAGDEWEYNTDFQHIDETLVVRDLANADRDMATPYANAVLVASDTGDVYEGDGTSWNHVTRRFGEVYETNERVATRAWVDANVTELTVHGNEYHDPNFSAEGHDHATETISPTSIDTFSTNALSGVEGTNLSVDTGGTLNVVGIDEMVIHDMGGGYHSADTLANLNTKVSDATLDDSGDTRPPQSHDNAAHSTNYSAEGHDHATETVSPASIDTFSTNALSDVEGTNLSVDTNGVLNVVDVDEMVAHDMGGAYHSADTLANLNTKVSDATLDDSGDTRPPQSHDNAAHSVTFAVDGDAQPPETHAIGGSAHSEDTLTNLNSKVSDATLDDSGDTRPPQSHDNAVHSTNYSAEGHDHATETVSPASIDTFSTNALSDVEGANLSVGTGGSLNVVGIDEMTTHDMGGGYHNADTLANLNTKVSDATLDDSGSSRPPQSHDNAAHSTNYSAEGHDHATETISPASIDTFSTNALSDVEGTNLSVDTGGALNVVGIDEMVAHDMGGGYHNADTLANLNSKVSDATLDDSGDTRPPQSHDNAAHSVTFAVDGDAQPPETHAIGGSAHSEDTLANLNTKVSDATLDDSGSSRPPQSHDNAAHSTNYSAEGHDHATETISPASIDTFSANALSDVEGANLSVDTNGALNVVGIDEMVAHDLGGGYHNADTLANLNTKVSDATLDDSGDTRPPQSHDNAAHSVTFAVDGDAQPPETHAIGGSAHSEDTLTNLNSKVSDATLDDSGSSRPPQSHDNAAHSTDYASDTSLTNHEASQNPHSGSASTDHDNAAHSLEFISDGDGIARQVWVIAAGASDPAGADPEDIIFEEE